MENTIVKTLIHEGQVRFYFVDNTQLLRKIFELNKEISDTLKLLLGKTVSTMSILSGTLKGNQRVSLQMTLSDSAHKVFAETEANENVRVYLNEALLKSPGLETQSMEDLIGPLGMIRIIKGSDMSQFTSIKETRRCGKMPNSSTQKIPATICSTRWMVNFTVILMQLKTE